MSQHHDTDHNPEDLYEPFYAMSYPWLGIFGFIHPYAEILTFGASLAAGPFMAGWGTILTFTDGPGWLGATLVALFGLGGIGGFGVFIGAKRTVWMHRYTRLTGTNPAFGDPANKHPRTETLGRLARHYWTGKFW